MSRVSLQRFLPADVCGRVVVKVLAGMSERPLKEILATDRDRDYFFACLRCGLTIGQADAVLKMYDKIFDWNTCVIEDLEKLNKYVRIFFRDIPSVFNRELNISEDVRLLGADLVGKMATPNDISVSKFTQETWGAALTCLLECAPKYQGMQPLNPFIRKFLSVFHLVNLEIDTAKALMHDFSNVCFGMCENDGAASWDEFFRTLFTVFLTEENVEKKWFLMTMIAEMKKLGKEIDTGPRKVGKWSVIGNYFKLAMNTLRMELRQRTGTGLFRSVMPGETLMKAFADGCFLTEFRDFAHVFDHIKDVSKVFTQSVFDGDSQWPDVFASYISNLLRMKDGIDKAAVCAIINHIANLSAERPHLMSKMLSPVLSAAAALKYSDSGTDGDLFSIHHAYWPNLLANVLCRARAEKNQGLEVRMNALIAKFTTGYVFLGGTEDLQVQVLMLIALAEDENGLARRLLALGPNMTEAYKIRKGLVANFALLVLGLAPHYISHFGVAITNCKVMETIVGWLDNPSSDETHAISFMIAIIEIAHKSNLFVKHRSFVPCLVQYLRSLRETSDNPVVKSLAVSVLLLIEFNPVSVEQIRSFEASYPKRYIFAINEMIVVFGETENGHAIGITIRTKAGASLLEVSPTGTEPENPPPEDTLPANALRRDQVDIECLPPFMPLRLTNGPVRSRTLTFLSAMGVFAAGRSTPPKFLGHDETLLKELEKLDKMHSVIYNIRVTNVVNDSTSYDELHETEQFRRFRNDLRPSFHMGICTFCFGTDCEAPDNDILIVFNEANRRLSGRHEKSEKYPYKIVISVTPVYQGLHQDILTYNVSVVKASEAYLILPFVHKKPRVAPPESLALTICSVLFFFKAQCLYDRVAGTNECSLANEFHELCSRREEQIASIAARFGVEDLIENGPPQDLMIANQKNKVVVIAVTSKDTSWRIPELMEFWGNDFQKSHFSAGIFFDYIDWHEEKFPTIPRPTRLLELVGVVDSDRKKVIDCAIKEVAAAEFFLKHTSAGWLLRIVDDTFINIPALEEMISELPNPDGHRYLFGDCVDGDKPFIHGGSGYLMSRGIAAALVSYGDIWIQNLVQRPPISTEEYFNDFLSHIHYPLINASSPRFMGLFLDPFVRELTPYKCRYRPDWKHCPKHPMAIAQTVAFHDPNHRMTMSKWKDLISTASPTTMWMRDGHEDFLCSR